MYRTIVLILAVISLTASVSAQAPSNANQSSVIAIPTTDAAIALLGRKVDLVDWDEAPLEEVVDWLRQQGEYNVNVIVRWPSLETRGVGRETLVTLTLNNTNVAQVLDEVLLALGDSSDDVAYRGSGNNLWISSKQNFRSKLHVRVYNVSDILFRVPNFQQGAPSIDLQNDTGGGQGGGRGSQGVFTGGQGGGQNNQLGQQEGQGGQEDEQRMTDLRELIEQTIAPETWDTGNVQGGQVATTMGRIRTYNRSLVVRASAEVHEMIGGFFLENG